MLRWRQPNDTQTIQVIQVMKLEDSVNINSYNASKEIQFMK